MTKLCFAHYFTPYPISLDDQQGQPSGFTGDYYNRNYLNPAGESTSTTAPHAAYGGLLRDRPIPRAPIGTGYQDIDMQTEVRRAIASGLDGFSLDLFTAAVHVTRQQQLLAAADAVAPGAFKVMLMPDMTSWGSISAATFASRIANLARYPAAHRLPDGRLVISCFKAETWTPAQWQAALDATVTSIAALNLGYTGVAFVPVFLSYSSNIAAFKAGITHLYGASVWGGRNPAVQTGQAALAADAHSRGLIWMQPVSVQDERPNQHIYDEANNTQNLRDSWGAAMGKSGGVGGTTVANGVADWVQIPTWNDFSEGAHICPSVQRGYTYITLSAYYMAWWKTGTAPTPVNDQIYLTHRIQQHGTAPTYAETSLMTLRAGSSPARDLVEVLTILTAPATVTVTVGGVPHTFTAAAGVAVNTVPLVVGSPVTASFARAGEPPLNVSTPTDPTATPYVQDLQYVGGVAQRTPAGGGTPLTGGRLLGVNDASKPTPFLDTLEGAYSGGSGSGIGQRVPVVHVIAGFTITASLTAGARDLALFDAGHELMLSFRAPALYSSINDGSNDAAIDAFGDRIYALGYGAAVSGAQAGAGYGGFKAQQLRICFMPQADADTTRGTAAEFQTAWRRFFGRIKARRPSGAPERVVAVPIFTGLAATNGAALRYLPGTTAGDFVDEIGVNYFVATGGTTSFVDLFAPWLDWIATNAPKRKLFVAQTAIHQDAAAPTRQADWIAGMAAALIADTRYSGACWWSPDNYTTTPDDRVLAKSINASGWQAFHDAVSAAAAAGTPPPDTTPPGVPTGLSATQITTTAVTLTWNVPGDPDYAGVQLFRDGALLATLGPTVTTYTVSSQAPGSDHSYTLKSFDDKTPPNVSVATAPLPVHHPSATAPLPPSINSGAVIMNESTAAATAAATDPSAGTLLYSWDWGDGSPDSTSTTATHDYALPGTYSVTLSVSSLASGLTTTQVFTVQATVAASNLTPFLGLFQPVPGQRVGLFGPNLRANNVLLDQVLRTLLTRAVQNDNDPVITSRPLVSYQGTLSVADEAPSAEYPDGRIIVTGV